jgi:hypothetical protein
VKRPIPAILAAFTALGCVCGCTHRLPNLKAEEIHTRTTVMGVALTADATGINVTETAVKAADAKWTISFPGFDHTTTAKGYQQKRKPEDDKP